MHRKEAKSALPARGQIFSLAVDAPLEIVREGQSDPIMQEKDPARRQHSTDLGEHRQWLVDDVQHRRHGDQVHGAGGVG
jgi:hypothetical protein